MFKNRAVQVSLVKKDAENGSDTTPRAYQDPEQMKAIAQDLIKDTAKVVGAVFIASFVARAACTIAVKIVESALED